MGYTHSLRTPSSVSDTATAVRVLYHKPGGFVKGEIDAALPRKVEKRLKAFFKIYVPTRDGRTKGLRRRPFVNSWLNVRGTRP